MWFLLLLVVAGLAVAALPAAFATMGPLRHSEGAANALADPSEGLAAVLVLLLLPFVWGGIFAFPLMVTAAMTGLSLVYVARALDRGFAAEKLSFSTLRDDVMGGPRAGGVAMSLQPVRSTPASDLLLRAYWAGWSPGAGMYLAASILGAAYLFTVGWIFWPVEGWPLQAGCAAVSLTLTGWGGRRYGRAFRERPVGRRPA